MFDEKKLKYSFHIDLLKICSIYKDTISHNIEKNKT